MGRTPMMAAVAKPFELFEATIAHRAFLDLDPDAPDFGFFRPLLQYWTDRRGVRVAPARADLDPLELPPALLPHMLLIDVEHDPVDFRYRLAGTAADTIHGQSLKGVRILDLRPEPFARTLHGDLVRMTADLAVQFTELSFTNREDKTRRYRVLRLPLCDETGRLTMILVLADHGAITR
jgi:hypothetical protein